MRESKRAASGKKFYVRLSRLINKRAPRSNLKIILPRFRALIKSHRALSTFDGLAAVLYALPSFIYSKRTEKKEKKNERVKRRKFSEYSGRSRRNWQIVETKVNLARANDESRVIGFQFAHGRPIDSSSGTIAKHRVAVATEIRAPCHAASIASPRHRRRCRRPRVSADYDSTRGARRKGTDEASRSMQRPRRPTIPTRIRASSRDATPRRAGKRGCAKRSPLPACTRNPDTRRALSPGHQHVRRDARRPLRAASRRAGILGVRNTHVRPLNFEPARRRGVCVS